MGREGKGRPAHYWKGEGALHTPDLIELVDQCILNLMVDFGDTLRLTNSDIHLIIRLSVSLIPKHTSPDIPHPVQPKWLLNGLHGGHWE